MLVDHLTALGFGFVTRIILGFTNYTKALGLKLSDTKEGTGFQDAITPPKFFIIALIVYGLSVIFLVYGFTDNPISTGFTFLIIYIISLIITGAIFFMPNKASPFEKLFFKIIIIIYQMTIHIRFIAWHIMTRMIGSL